LVQFKRFNQSIHYTYYQSAHARTVTHLSVSCYRPGSLQHRCTIEPVNRTTGWHKKNIPTPHNQFFFLAADVISSSLMSKALSTLATIVAGIVDNLSPNSATVAVYGDRRRIRRHSPFSATVSEFGDCSRRKRRILFFSRDSPNSATIVASVDRALKCCRFAPRTITDC